ncbi:MAG TPA: hypothetical protein VHI52_10760 [Verrucomicrobiae bacterium]|nr:hypothetical protein [Verrucomicrobiae bacterium]
MKPLKIYGLSALPVMLLLTGVSVHAHEHLAAGADSNAPGSPLIFVNAGDYATNSGYAFALDAGQLGSAYEGWYFTADLVFAALAASPNYGGPEAQAAALGSHIEVVLESLTGPSGAHLGFWETQQDGVDSTNLTWTVPVGLANGTNQIVVSETDGSPTADPYGHIHGRVYSVDKPGLYTLGLRFDDTSTNGIGGGPIQSPSAPFYLYFQADITIAGIQSDANGVNLTFAAPSNLPDSGTAPATNYQIESTTGFDPADWHPVGDIIVGDDHLHTVTLPRTGGAGYFRLNTF